jgi:signal transduction histidine kinase
MIEEGVSVDPVEAREPGTRGALAWGLFALTVAMLPIALLLGDVGGSLIYAPLTLGFAGVGALVAARTDNRVGWLFLAESFALAFAGTLQAYGAHTPPLPGAAWFAWSFEIALAYGLVPLTIAILVFPDGRLPSRRWLPVGWVTFAAATVTATCAAISDVNFGVNFPHLADPVTPVSADAVSGLYNFSQLLGLMCLLAAAISLVVRLVRARGDQRLQLKWFVYASCVATLIVVVVAQFSNDPGWAFALFFTLVPIAAGVAIFKYRLYDIDLVIRRTVVFGAMAAFITVVYIAVVVGAALVLGTEGRNPLLAILATAIVAIAFQPVRDRADHVAGRLVYGERATPYEVLARFSERVGDTYATEDVLPETARIVAEGVGADAATVWLRVGDRLRAVASWPGEAEGGRAMAIAVDGNDLPELPGDLSVAVRDREGLIGALSVSKPRGEPLTPADLHLLDDLASQEGLVLSNAQLTAELEARLAAITERSAELKASRRRVVAAQDAERRRLERNIHDGAQQHLVALAVKLRLAKTMLERDPARGRALLDEVRAQVDDALDNLQALALGIYPPALERDGVAAALRADVVRLGLPVHLRADGVSRHPIETEAAVYFCVLEALQNTAKHAGATSVDVDIAERDGILWFEVADDGVGFDPSANGNGTGLAGMRDRLAILGGDASLESAPGRGTTVRGRVPARPLEGAR